MMPRPTVSIVIPAFNVQDYIGQTLNSVIEQTFQDWEALVVDDASEDGTFMAAQEYAKKDPRIKVMRNVRPKGVSGTRNTGIRNASGEWIAFLDGDDLFDHRTLEHRVASAKQLPDCSFISGDFLILREDGTTEHIPQSLANSRWRGILHAPDKPHDAITVLEKPIEHFVDQVLTWTGCAMVKAELLQHLGGFDESLETAEDVQLWMRVAASVHSMVFVPKSLSLYRQRPRSLTNSGKALYRHSVRAYSLLLSDPLMRAYRPKIKKKMAYFAHQNTFFYRSTGQRAYAIYWSLKAISIDPRSPTSWRNLIAAIMLR
jgi:glycosyltransferase involved in cell wall biosynthesis